MWEIWAEATMQALARASVLKRVSFGGSFSLLRQSSEAGAAW